MQYIIFQIFLNYNFFHNLENLGINMSYVEKIDLNNLINFSKTNSYLSIVEREIPRLSNSFFENLITEPLNISGQIFKNKSLKSIKHILNKNIPDNYKKHSFYNHWVKDMSNISNIFCNIIDSDSISFSLGSSRGCRRYHIDNVPMRLLVTYYGDGTEWLPPNATNYDAYYNGKNNENIVKIDTEKKFIDTWDIAIFRGGEKGILHRTPDSALNSPTLQMRLDYSSFLNDVERYNNINL